MHRRHRAGRPYIAYGSQSSPDFKAARVDLPLIALDRRTLTFSELFEVTDNPVRFAVAQEYIRDAILRDALKPAIDRRFPLAEVQAAHRHLETGPGHRQGRSLPVKEDSC